MVIEQVFLLLLLVFYEKYNFCVLIFISFFFHDF
jgi:hypothetical protein